MRDRIAIIGLGKMGSNLAKNMMRHGWEVVGYNRTRSVTDQLVDDTDGKLIPAYSYADVVKKASCGNDHSGCCYIWIMLPAGKIVDDVIAELKPHLRKHDMIIDGGNGFYKDAQRRSADLAKVGVRFMDIGVSGGPKGALKGACMMVGGSEDNFEEIEDLFEKICVEDGYAHFEGSGAGHFVKMVHNGIEYGMMESIAEGFAILKSCNDKSHECPYDIDLEEAARVYNHGSVIKSRLIGWLQQAFKEWGSNLETVQGSAHATGEGKWTVEVAQAMGIEHGAIQDALNGRAKSQKQPSFHGKLIQAMRGQFGGHPVLEGQKPSAGGSKASSDKDVMDKLSEKSQ